MGRIQRYLERLEKNVGKNHPSLRAAALEKIEDLYQLHFWYLRPGWFWSTLKFRLPGFHNSRQEFLSSIFTMLAGIASADHRLREVELVTIEEFIDLDFRLDTKLKTFALRKMREGRLNPRAFEVGCTAFSKITSKDPRLARNLVFLLWSLAMSDGVVAHEEERLIRMALRMLSLPEVVLDQVKAAFKAVEAARELLYDFQDRVKKENSASFHERIKKTWQGEDASTQDTYEQAAENPLTQAFQTLGCNRGDSLQTIKRRYRLLVVKHHPDKIVGQNKGAAAIKEAERKFREIQEAFELISAQLADTTS